MVYFVNEPGAEKFRQYGGPAFNHYLAQPAGKKLLQCGADVVGAHLDQFTAGAAQTRTRGYFSLAQHNAPGLIGGPALKFMRRVESRVVNKADRQRGVIGQNGSGSNQNPINLRAYRMHVVARGLLSDPAA